MKEKIGGIFLNALQSLSKHSKSRLKFYLSGGISALSGISIFLPFTNEFLPFSLLGFAASGFIFSMHLADRKVEDALLSFDQGIQFFLHSNIHDENPWIDTTMLHNKKTGISEYKFYAKTAITPFLHYRYDHLKQKIELEYVKEEWLEQDPYRTFTLDAVRLKIATEEQQVLPTLVKNQQVVDDYCDTFTQQIDELEKKLNDFVTNSSHLTHENRHLLTHSMPNDLHQMKILYLSSQQKEKQQEQLTRLLHLFHQKVDQFIQEKEENISSQLHQLEQLIQKRYQ